MPEIFNQALLKIFGDAQAALARAEERLALTPKPDVLRAQLRLMEQEALGFVEGKLVSPTALTIDYGHSRTAYRQWPFEFASLFGRPLPSGKPPTPDKMSEWLGDPSRQTDATPDRIEAWQRQSKPSCALPRLIAGADLAARWLKCAPLLRGNVVAGVIIGDLYSTARSSLSSGGIAAIGMKRQRIYWMRVVGGDADDDLDDTPPIQMWRMAWLKAMTDGANAVLELDDRLRRYWTHVENSALFVRRSSRMADLVELVAQRPAITVRGASEALNISRHAAHSLIQSSESALLLRETTRGKSFRRYVAAF